MFRESLLETSAASVAQRGWATLMSFGLEMTGVALLVIVPLFVNQAVPMFQAPPVPPTTSVTPEQIKNAIKLMTGMNTAFDDGVFRAPKEIPDEIFIPKGKEKPRVAPVLVDPCETCVYVANSAYTGPSSGPNVISNILNVVPPTVKPPVVEERKTLKISHIDEGMLLTRIEPLYPHLAKIARVEGTVVLGAMIGADGRIENLRVISGPPMLLGAAIDAVRQWRYRPTMLNGRPVEVETTISVRFTLRQG